MDKALLAFWTGRDAQAQRQRDSGRTDAGTRGAVTGGAHLDEVTRLFANVCSDAGAPAENIAWRGGQSNKTRLAGHYRPTKSWDLVVWDEGRPVAVLELKSQVGSFGNNANNRAEEALGNAVDLARATRQLVDQPWRGYVFVIEDSEASRRGTSTRIGEILDDEFRGSSYVDRVRILAERMSEDGLYDSSWVVATKAPPNFSWLEPSSRTTGIDGFVASLQEHLAGWRWSHR